MSRILKKFREPVTTDYVFQPAHELLVDPLPVTQLPQSDILGELPEAPLDPNAPVSLHVNPDPDADLDNPSDADAESQSADEVLSFAQIQAEAIIKDAKLEAAAYKAQMMEEFEQEMERTRAQAHEDGFRQGYTEGMDKAMEEGRAQIQARTEQLIGDVAAFMEQATRERDALYERHKEDMKDLAMAVAEKVIRVSLKNSSDILLRMVDAATDTHKKCEWAHIYVADTDLHGKVYTMPELIDALGHISDRIRVIPMSDDESGTCIVELPDVILDASVSTQMGNIRDLLSGIGVD